MSTAPQHDMNLIRCCPFQSHSTKARSFRRCSTLVLPTRLADIRAEQAHIRVRADSPRARVLSGAPASGSARPPARQRSFSFFHYVSTARDAISPS